MRRYGGSKQNGIAPSGQSPNVFVYSDPLAAEEFGYVEEWDTNRTVLRYTGDGQVGDQNFNTRGNRAVRDHKADGRALRLFEAAGTKPGSEEVIQRYVGRMEIDDNEPYTMQAGVPDRNGDLRSVIVFKLRRVEDEVTPETVRLDAGLEANDDDDQAVEGDAVVGDHGEVIVRTVPVEKSNAESFVAEYKALSRKERSRAEAKLQKKYRKHLESSLHRQVSRHQISIDGQLLYTDLYDETTDDLIEVKSSVDRNTMRLALGQILDYSSVVNPAHRTLVVPEEPKRGLLDLFRAHGVRVVWPEGDGFMSSP
jgi:hypothetical protein